MLKELLQPYDNEKYQERKADEDSIKIKPASPTNTSRLNLLTKAVELGKWWLFLFFLLVIIRINAEIETQIRICKNLFKKRNKLVKMWPA